MSAADTVPSVLLYQGLERVTAAEEISTMSVREGLPRMTNPAWIGVG